ncbi:MAG TPA: HAD family phosphatase [Kiritimatiellia bacterium]|nr:HAD family phosphatase [Kiritimatiellia bacterium]HRZ12485.1 HAD family phosphatase [Kiritimatiellia bacterium]HSA17757.1 HAD family phosphatase [Kiritimatiellia bacterium]
MTHAINSLAAVVFDFDGVIVDTEPLHFEAFRRIASPHGIELAWEAYRQKYMGFDDRDAFRALFRDAGRPLAEERLAGLIDAKAAAFAKLAESEGVEPYPGAARLIGELAGRVPLALCSGALRSDVQPILARAGLKACFAVMVTAEDVSVSKPDPESYREALRRLAARFPDRTFPASRCVAIEDTPAGIAAARGAGLKVLAVRTTHAHGPLAAADCVQESLQALRVEDLEALARD